MTRAVIIFWAVYAVFIATIAVIGWHLDRGLQ